MKNNKNKKNGSGLYVIKPPVFFRLENWSKELEQRIGAKTYIIHLENKPSPNIKKRAHRSIIVTFTALPTCL